MNNPPAFPTPVIVPEGQFTTLNNDGMTLRDYFAAAIAQGIMANPDWQGDVGKTSYKFADAMLKAREQQ